MNPSAHTKFRVLLFVRAPELGKVKTRLARSIGADNALALYRRFTADLLAMLKLLPFGLTLFFHPAGKESLINNWLGDAGTFYAQKGPDLGRRMAGAFEQSFADGAQRAILIGTDIPGLPARIIIEGFDRLTQTDAVIGPATDGGYYLIGCNRKSFKPVWFDGIEWGEADVLQKQIQHIEDDRRTVFRLPSWPDIDEIDDLRRFWRKNQRTPERARRTIDYINQNAALTQKLVSV